jgi:hypothetical protein
MFNIVELELIGEHNGKVVLLIGTVIPKHIHFLHCREDNMPLE